MLLMLASSVLLIFALEEGGARYSWNSAAIIASLVVAMACGIAFAGWELWIDSERSVQEPVFPPRILKDRVLVALLLYVCLPHPTSMSAVFRNLVVHKLTGCLLLGRPSLSVSLSLP
jgi:hypothetical protein